MPLARRQLLHKPLTVGLSLAGVALAVALVGILLALPVGINRQAKLMWTRRRLSLARAKG